MKRILTTAWLCLALLQLASANVSVYNLRVENMTCPLGIDTDKPRFSWKISSDGKEKSVRQKAYRLLVASSPEMLKDGGVPPLPIPNREVKHACADGTAMQCGRVGGRHLYLRALIQQ